LCFDGLLINNIHLAHRYEKYEIQKKSSQFCFFKYLPQYVSLHIVIIQPSVCLTVVWYNNCIGLVHNPFTRIILLHAVLQMLYMSSVHVGRRDTVILQVVSEFLEDWIASSYGQALHQKAHMACLTVKIKAVQSLKRYLPGDKMSYTRRLE